MAPLNGLELSRRFYEELVRPWLAEAAPGLPHAAALLGYGSELLGFDDAMTPGPQLGSARAPVRGAATYSNARHALVGAFADAAPAEPFAATRSAWRTGRIRPRTASRRRTATSATASRSGRSSTRWRFGRPRARRAARQSRLAGPCRAAADRLHRRGGVPRRRRTAHRRARAAGRLPARRLALQAGLASGGASQRSSRSWAATGSPATSAARA